MGFTAVVPVPGGAHLGRHRSRPVLPGTPGGDITVKPEVFLTPPPAWTAVPITLKKVHEC